MADTDIKCVEVKNYPIILNILSRINKEIIRPTQEKLLDDYEKAHNISKPSVENNEPSGNRETNNNR